MGATKIFVSARSNSIKQIGHPSLDIAIERFKWKAANMFIQLPASIKSLENLETFKLENKKWVRANTPVHSSQT